MWIKYILHEKYDSLKSYYDLSYGDTMFCEWNFWKLCFFYTSSSALSTRIIVDIIWPLSTGIIVDLYIPW